MMQSTGRVSMVGNVNFYYVLIVECQLTITQSPICFGNCGTARSIETRAVLIESSKCSKCSKSSKSSKIAESRRNQRGRQSALMIFRWRVIDWWTGGGVGLVSDADVGTWRRSQPAAPTQKTPSRTTDRHSDADADADDAGAADVPSGQRRWRIAADPTSTNQRRPFRRPIRPFRRALVCKKKRFFIPNRHWYPIWAIVRSLWRFHGNAMTPNRDR